MVVAVPTFAVVGAVNAGKSSVVSALAEDDSVRVSDTPGLTKDVKRFNLREFLVFYDTPGFQNPRKALAAIKGIDASHDSLDSFRQFIRGHKDLPEFDAECRLLAPITDGAGIIYVVDASQPVVDLNRCEMDILRRTGAPRLAIINRTGDDHHAEAWKSALSQNFNIVREFDAHEVTFADRKDLLEALAIIERAWKEPLGQALLLLEAERAERLADSASLITDFLVEALGYSVKSQTLKDMSLVERKSMEGKLRKRYMNSIVRMELGMHKKVIELYAHRRVSVKEMSSEDFGRDLFGVETWQLFGLDSKQLMRLSAVAGGAIGAVLDAVTLGHSLGIGALVGAAAGVGGAFALGKRRPEIAINWPTASLPGPLRSYLPASALRFAGGEISVGPFQAENYPWILLDRALGTFAYVSTRSHARRDEGVANAESFLLELKDMGLTVASWSTPARGICQKVFKALRDGKRVSAEQRGQVRDVVLGALRSIEDAERRIGGRGT